MSKLTDKQKEELIYWAKNIYQECDDVEFPDLIVDKLYEFAVENGDIPEKPEEFIPETMPFGKHKGKRICDLNRGYIETLLMHRSKNMHVLLVKALKQQLRDIDSADMCAESLENDYELDDSDLTFEEQVYNLSIPNRF